MLRIVWFKTHARRQSDGAGFGQGMERISLRLTRRVVRFNSRTPRALSSAWTWSLTVVVNTLRLRAAAEKPPFSATRTKALMLARRSIDPLDFPAGPDSVYDRYSIIVVEADTHLPVVHQVA